MSKLQMVFTDFINAGSDAAKRITEPKDRAMAYAALAQAIAQSKLMDSQSETGSDTATETTGKESLKAESGKAKTKSKAKEKEVKEEIVPEVETVPETEAAVAPETPETIVEEEIEEEWSEKMQEVKAEQIGVLNQYIESWTEEYIVTECMTRFFEDSSITADQLWAYIRPTNIDGFIAYLASIAE